LDAFYGDCNALAEADIAAGPVYTEPPGTSGLLAFKGFCT
jgi:hypothetical protein